MNGLRDPEPELAKLFAEQVDPRARREDLPTLVSFLAGRRAEWEASEAEVTVGKAIGRLGGFDTGYKAQDMTAMCGNPYMAAEGAIYARSWWKKSLGPSDAEASNELFLHDGDWRRRSDFGRMYDPVNRRAREKVLAWWRRKGAPPLVSAAAPPLKSDPRAFLREHPIKTTVSAIGPIRYERAGFVRVIPVTVAAGSRQALYAGAVLRYPNLGDDTEITLTAVSQDSSEGDARQYGSLAPLANQRLPYPGLRLRSAQFAHDDSEEQ